MILRKLAICDTQVNSTDGWSIELKIQLLPKNHSAASYIKTYSWQFVKLKCFFPLQGGNIESPQITQPYQPPNVCTDGSSGAAHVMLSTFTIILLPLLACFF